jgi:hypothetical protein
MPCPVCGPLAAAEGPLLKHLLRRHPEAQVVAAAGLSLGTVVLSRKPQLLLWFYFALLAMGVFLSISDRPAGSS